MHRIRIHQGDIKGLKVDVVVNPLVHDREPEVSHCAGHYSEHSCSDQNCADHHCVGEPRVVFGSSLAPQKAVIEVVGPLWRGGDFQEDEALATCYKRAMDLAKQQNFRSIAFAPISCGPLGFPANRASKIAIEQISFVLQQNPFMETVVLCCSDPVTSALYRSAVGR
ncbi:MAG: macro domain-containing protein [Porticoccaceae bacterium]|nr:macro domain-containing protein [Porticoccaceae bacterium]